MNLGHNLNNIRNLPRAKMIVLAYQSCNTSQRGEREKKKIYHQFRHSFHDKKCAQHTIL